MHRFAAGAILAGALPLSGRAAEADAVDSVQKAAADWVKVRAETSRVQTEWATQQQLLESMVNALTERAQTLEAKRDFLQARTARDRDERVRIEAQNKASAGGMAQLEEQLKAMDARLLELRPSLPPRLSEALDLPYRSLANKEVTVSERLQLTMTVLNRCTQFNRGITCGEEVLAPNKAAEARLLDVIYWGLSHGYALDRAAGQVWFGSPGPSGWLWEPAPEGAKGVARLIAIYRSKGEPEFISVPARLAKTSTAVAGGSRP